MQGSIKPSHRTVKSVLWIRCSKCGALEKHSVMALKGDAQARICSYCQGRRYK